VNCICYSSAEEAIEMAAHYLVDQEERERIALAGQQIALSEHTYNQRWAEIMRKSIGVRNAAPIKSMKQSEIGLLNAAILRDIRMPLRVLAVAQHYGASKELLFMFLAASGKWLNARVPLTPNALKARLKR
jgi:hypothetical protein